MKRITYLSLGLTLVPQGTLCRGPGTHPPNTAPSQSALAPIRCYSRHVTNRTWPVNNEVQPTSIGQYVRAQFHCQEKITASLVARLLPLAVSPIEILLLFSFKNREICTHSTLYSSAIHRCSESHKAGKQRPFVTYLFHCASKHGCLLVSK